AGGRATRRTPAPPAAAAGPGRTAPATRSNSARNRSSICGQRSLSSRRSTSRRSPGRAGRAAGDAANRPGVFAISVRMRARKSALEVTPALLERTCGDGRQVARSRPVAEEVRQGADAAGTHEWSLSRAADARCQSIQPRRLQGSPACLEDDALGPRRGPPLVAFLAA